MEKRPKILLVDDEPYNLDYLEQELEELELEILTATNGHQALEVVVEHAPDMIFLDIMMPVMDGFAVLERLKGNPAWNAIPVVIISAANDLASVVRGIEMGAEDFLPKPINPVLLHARLNAGLEKKRLRDIEQAYLKSLERELEIGREIQQGFLPHAIPQPDGWEIEAFFQAAREVAGDFYDVFDLGSDKLGLLLGDVTDKGVGSALYMALFRTLLRATLTLDAFSANPTPGSEYNPETHLKKAVSFVNDYICRIHDSAMYATLFLGILDTRTGQLCYVNAGHDTPYILRGNAVYAKLGPSGPIVGAIEGVEYQTQALILMPGDRLVLYSDGITDAQNQSGELFGKARWQQLLEGVNPDKQRYLTVWVESILNFMGEANQADDISLLTIQRLN